MEDGSVLFLGTTIFFDKSWNRDHAENRVNFNKYARDLNARTRDPVE